MVFFRSKYRGQISVLCSLPFINKVVKRYLSFLGNPVIKTIKRKGAAKAFYWLLLIGVLSRKYLIYFQNRKKVCPFKPHAQKRLSPALTVDILSVLEGELCLRMRIIRTSQSLFFKINFFYDFFLFKFKYI